MAATDRKAGLLSPYRVLDLSNELGFLCGRILGDLGADVVKIEPPGGDPAREQGLYWLAFNANKRGITLDLKSGAGRALFLRLAKRADFILEGFHPGTLDYGELSRENPGVIL